MIIPLENTGVTLWFSQEPESFLDNPITFEEAILLMFEECGISKEDIISDFSKNKSENPFEIAITMIGGSVSKTSTSWESFICDCTRYLQAFGEAKHVYSIVGGDCDGSHPQGFVNFMMQYFACAK